MKETPSKVGYLRKIAEIFSAGCSLSDQHILSQIYPKYNDWICQIYVDLHILSYFGLIGDKICWSDKV